MHLLVLLCFVVLIAHNTPSFLDASVIGETEVCHIHLALSVRIPRVEFYTRRSMVLER
jgi:hypothetical protein